MWICVTTVTVKIQNSWTKLPAVTPLEPFPLSSLTPSNHYSVLHIYNFAILRKWYEWNHTGYSLLNLTIFTQHEQEWNFFFYKNQYSIWITTNRTLQASLCGCLIYGKLSGRRREPTCRPTHPWLGWLDGGWRWWGWWGRQWWQGQWW